VPGRISTLRGDGELAELAGPACASEALLPRLLADHPRLLAGAPRLGSQPAAAAWRREGPPSHAGKLQRCSSRRTG
jgi:hypothetical protein